MDSKAANAAAATDTPAEEAPSIFGKVDCAAFNFATDDDATVYAAIEEVLSDFQLAPSLEAFAAVQSRLVALAGYPLVTAVIAGRYPCLFSALKAQSTQLETAGAAPAEVAGVDWDLWCRNTWLTNSCAVDDLGAVATSTLSGLPALLRRVERDNDNHVNEVWSVLHILAWALRSSAAADALVDPLTQCAALWELIETELVKGGRHTSLQLVLLDLLGALALHASASPVLFDHLCTVAGARAQFPHPVHYHTAMKLCYACVLCDDAAQTKTRPALQHLERAWTNLKSQAPVIPPPLRATEWVVGAEAKAHLAIALQLHRQLKAAGDGALDLATVSAFHKTAAELPAEARAFCLYALPGNALLRLHATLHDAAAAADVVAEVVATLVDVVLGREPATKEAKAAVEPHRMDGYVQYCIQQMWMNGLSATLHTLLQRREPAITAAVVCLLHHLAARSLHGSAARRVLLGSPSLSLVGDVLSGVAETADVKAELKKPEVVDVVDAALRLICALDNAELTSVFADSLVFTVGTLISEGKDNAVLLRRGLQALARLASAFPMAGSLVLDFEFLTEQCAVADPPENASAALVVGSLDVMSAIVVQQPAAVTFEWIEMLLNIMQNLAGWRDSVEGLDVALWRCVRRTVEVSEDCYEYLFSEEAQEVLRNELERMKYQDAQLPGILPSLLGISVCMQAVDHPELNAHMTAALAAVPATAWAADLSEGALRFAAAACGDASDEAKDDALAAPAVAAVAESVMLGAQQSGVMVPPAALEEFARGLEEKGVALDVLTALFRTVEKAAESQKGEEVAGAKKKAKAATTQGGEEATLPLALLPLLHCLLSNCPSARTEATASSAAHLLTSAAAGGGDGVGGMHRPEVIDAALLLVNDACAMNFTNADDEAKRTRVMEELWPSLAAVTRQAAEQQTDASWQRVLGRVYGAAHALLLGSTKVPFSADGDPRLDFVGACGLPYVSMEPCNALVQTVLNYDEARAYLKHKYAADYLTSLEYMADPAHNVSGMVPLSLQRYLSEAKMP